MRKKKRLRATEREAKEPLRARLDFLKPRYAVTAAKDSRGPQELEGKLIAFGCARGANSTEYGPSKELTDS